MEDDHPCPFLQPLALHAGTGLATTVRSPLTLGPLHILFSSRLPCPLLDCLQRRFLWPGLPLKMLLKRDVDRTTSVLATLQ